MQRISPRFLLAASLLALLLAALPPAAHASDRVALIIGNGAYKSAPLRNPARDARDLARTLEDLGFEVILRTDAGKRDMVEALDAFASRLASARAGVFFYAGHGMQVRGRNYLVPVGAHVSREADVEFEALDGDRVLAAMEDGGCPVNVVVLDACRNNPFASRFRSATRGLAVMSATRGMFIAYATSPGDVAEDGSGDNGLYTAQLLRHIRTPGLSVEALFKRVRGGVLQASDGRQIPWDSSSLTGDFSFAGGLQTMPQATAQAAAERPAPATVVAVAEPAPMPARALPTADDLAGTVWLQEIEDGNPPRTYVILRADGSFGYNYKKPGAYQGDDERWSVKGDTLTLSWNNGFCLDTFPMHGWGSGTVVGTQSVNNRRIVFTRVE